MESSPPLNALRCTQCGGELHPDEGQIFLSCPYCGSAVYLDKSRVVFHWYLSPTLDESKARASLARWMAGNQTVKDLDRKSQVTGCAFEYFPIWFFKRRQPGNREEILIEPAAATSVSELRRLRLPAGDLRKYDPNLDAQAHPPSVPLQAALSWIQERSRSEGPGLRHLFPKGPGSELPGSEPTAPERSGLEPAALEPPGSENPAQGELLEQALVHLPLYTFKYTYQGSQYTALVEAATGAVLANLFPAKAEAPYRLIGGVAAGVFLCLASFPAIGWLADQETGLSLGLAICAGVGVIAAPVLFAIAAWVASKV